MNKYVQPADKYSPKFELIDSLQMARSIVQMDHGDLHSQEELDRMGIIHQDMKDQDFVNTFRNLRTSIRAKMDKVNSSIVVSSVVNGGGSSFTAMNLAAAFAFDPQKTALLIDCNFKNPTLDQTFKVDTGKGLKDFLAGEVDDIGEIVYPSGIPRLRVVPVGGSNLGHVEYFTGDRMIAFMHEVKNRYPDRTVIVDAPPVQKAADTKIVGDLCDYIVLVIPYRGVTSGAVSKTVRAMGAQKIIGMVLNN